MEELGNIFVGIAAFILEVTFHALVFLWLLGRACFDPKYRQKVRDEWNKSNRKRTGIIMGLTMYSVALFFAFSVWVPTLGDRLSGEKENPKEETLELSDFFTPGELKEIGNTKEIDELLDVTKGILIQKLDKEGENNESAGTEDDETSDGKFSTLLGVASELLKKKLEEREASGDSTGSAGDVGLEEPEP